ncbi:MAG TPA: LPS-assembly protein LptD, partial [Candidatus Aerophobetes bacterium]|nr:LPS-assembly protein LptD [Candidatus Aerophobetes bacterium]
MSLPKTRKQGRFFWERNSNSKIGKVILLLFFAMAISFLFMVFPSFSSERTFQIKLQADYISSSEDRSTIIGRGRVNLEYKDVQIEAENVRINLHTSELLAWDKVNFKFKARRIEGENLRYNLEKGEGTIEHPKGREGLFFYRAEEAFFSLEMIELRKAYFTTCDLSLPHYKITADKISIRLEDEIVMSNVTFSLGNIPVFWLPFFVQYLREENRFILPSFGYSDFAGWSVQTGYYFYASPFFQAKLHLDYKEKKGWAEGIDISYRSKGGKGNLNTYFIKEKDTQEERWLVRLEHQQSFSKFTSLKLRLNRLSDQYFLKDYFGQEYQTAYLYLAHGGPGYNASILAQPALNPVFERGSIERLPQLKLNFDPQRIGESYLNSEEAIEITNFKKDDKSILRADGFLDISLRWTDFAYFKLRPRIGYHLFGYWYEREGEKLSDYRSIPCQELNLFSELTVLSLIHI